jgi:hypothetical protein
MTTLLDRPPFGDRDDPLFLREMTALTRHHLDGSPELRRMWPEWRGAESIEELPFVHVSVFKYLLLRTGGGASQRLLRSSGTSGASASRIALDDESSALQSRSSTAILSDFVGEETAPLLVVDHSSSLRQRGEISARVAAAMSLRPLATSITFLLAEPGNPASVRWSEVAEAAGRSRHLRVYGFTTALWKAWTAGVPAEVAALLRERRVDFVHSGGWKRLEAERVSREDFDALLLRDSGPGSRVVDYYGLVEQVGVVFPLCGAGYRHVPAWGGLVVRDPYTLAPLAHETGMLQLMNVLARGAPYHSVLTEDLGRMAEGNCECGRRGTRFELQGRIPMAETRGCANV